MTKLIPAVFENGRLKLLQSLSLPEHQKVLVAVAITNDEIPSLLLSKIAEGSPTYQFLNTPQEDIYSLSDGEEV